MAEAPDAARSRCREASAFAGAALDAAENASLLVACIGVGAMAFWVAGDVMIRAAGLQPTNWTADLAEYTLVWATFLAAPWLLRTGGHVRVDLVVHSLSPAWQRRFAGLSYGLGAAVTAILFVETCSTVYTYFGRNLVMARSWEVPQWLPYAAIPWGFLLMFFEFARRACGHFRHGERHGAGGPAGDVT